MRKTGFRSALCVVLALVAAAALLAVSAMADAPAIGTLTITAGQTQLSLGDLTAVDEATYSYEFDNSVSSVTLRVTAADETGTVTVNGEAAAADGNKIDLAVATTEKPYNTVTVEVKSGEETSTYTLRLVRKAPAFADDDATLASLSIPGVTLSPAFDPAVLQYTATVPYSVTSIAPVFAPTNPNAQADIYGNTTLAVGKNEFYILVIPVSGRPETYELTVTREQDPLLGDATLASLSVDGAMLTPVFSSSVQDYNVTVGLDVTAINVVAIAVNPKATVTVSDNASNLSDFTLVKVEVTSEDGTAKKTYTIVVQRSAVKSSDASLGSLSVDGAALSPAFSPDVMSYAVTVPNSVTSVTVNAVPNDAGATPIINGNTDLAVGRNTVTVMVMAEDGVSQKSYIIVVTREAEAPVPTDDATLFELTVDKGTLSPAFAPDVLEYTVTVENDVTAVNVTATTNDAGAKAVVSGGDKLAVGDNLVTVVVTASDGVAVKAYTITVTRKAAEPDPTDATPDAKLIKLTDAATGAKITISPAFDPEITEYTAEISGISSIKFSVTLADKNAKWRWDDADVSGYSRAVSDGENVYRIAGYVTGADGKRITKIYTFTVTATNAGQPVNPPTPPTVGDTKLKGITFDIEGLTLVPAFDPEVLEYSVTVPNDVTTVTVSGEANDPAAYVAARTLELREGDNVATLIVVSGENTSSYTVHVYRTPSTKDLTGEIKISGEAKVGETLTAQLVSDDPDAAADFAWYVNGTLVGNGASYIVSEDDAGKTITVTATGKDNYVGTLTSAEITVEKAADTDPLPPETDPVTPPSGRDVPPIVIILLILGCIGIVAAFVLFIMRNNKKR
ncbi:MAG: cadherin-like beta sandwich domain-containing protein [Clostridia bacterium]|nr:cadherin-like beta sandwich domain-containing protein [Clostridia bacterium]